MVSEIPHDSKKPSIFQSNENSFIIIVITKFQSVGT